MRYGILIKQVQNYLRIILKTEKSNWPKWTTTEERKNEYLNNFYEQHGFSLNRDTSW